MAPSQPRKGLDREGQPAVANEPESTEHYAGSDGCCSVLLQATLAEMDSCSTIMVQGAQPQTYTTRHL